MSFFEIVGWLGALLALLAYVVVTRYGTSRSYHLMNLLGATGLLVNAVHHRAVPLTALNALWASVAVCGMAIRRRPGHAVTDR